MTPRPAAGDADIAPALAALTQVATPGDVFDPAAMLRAVALLHALGEVDAARALQQFGADADLGPRREGGQLDGLPAFLAARLLYLPRDAAPIPPPALGKPDIDLSADPVLAPHWPLVVSCDVPFLPVASFFLGGAPTSAERFVEGTRASGRFRERPPTPSCAPVEAADRLIASPDWPALVPDEQAAYARSLVRRQALRAGRPAVRVDEDALRDLMTMSPLEVEPVWRRLADDDATRALRWDPATSSFSPR